MRQMICYLTDKQMITKSYCSSSRSFYLNKAKYFLNEANVQEIWNEPLEKYKHAQKADVEAKSLNIREKKEGGCFPVREALSQYFVAASHALLAASNFSLQYHP